MHAALAVVAPAEVLEQLERIAGEHARGLAHVGHRVTQASTAVVVGQHRELAGRRQVVGGAVEEPTRGREAHDHDEPVRTRAVQLVIKRVGAIGTTEESAVWTWSRW